MYNANDPYVDPLRRRFQQPDPQVPVVQQPQPLMAQQSAPGPQQTMQWVPGLDGDQGRQQIDMSGMGALLSRFKKPAGAIKAAMPMGGFEGKG